MRSSTLNSPIFLFSSIFLPAFFSPIFGFSSIFLSAFHFSEFRGFVFNISACFQFLPCLSILQYLPALICFHFRIFFDFLSTFNFFYIWVFYNILPVFYFPGYLRVRSTWCLFYLHQFVGLYGREAHVHRHTITSGQHCWGVLENDLGATIQDNTYVKPYRSKWEGKLCLSLISDSVFSWCICCKSQLSQHRKVHFYSVVTWSICHKSIQSLY